MLLLVYLPPHVLRYGYEIDVVTMCGGLAQSDLFVQTHADVLNVKVVRPKQVESVLLGAAMLGSRSDDITKKNMATVIQNMSGPGEVFEPVKGVQSFHYRKYRVFQAMVEDQKKYQKIMADD